MNLQYVPLLQIQRELQGMPRNYDRFLEYLRKITPDKKTVDLPPLGIMNPMGREHVTELPDALLALDADGVAVRALADVTAQVANVPGDFKVGLVIADDLRGAWTNRYDYEFSMRSGHGFGNAGSKPSGTKPKWLKDWWLTAILWSSGPASERAVREAVLSVVYRAAYVQQNGAARTLRDILIQEGHVMVAAGCSGPVLDAEDIAYTREVLVPFLDAEDMRTCMECLFGDTPGRTLGFTPRGLSPWAGLALALHDARTN